MMLMEPEPGDPQEIKGGVNPAAACQPNGKLFTFPMRHVRCAFGLSKCIQAKVIELTDNRSRLK